jgi:hypothetical protein
MFARQQGSVDRVREKAPPGPLREVIVVICRHRDFRKFDLAAPWTFSLE